MTKQLTKQLIYDQLCALADTVHELENNPSKKEVDEIIQNLYQVMRQLSDFAENGY